MAKRQLAAVVVGTALVLPMVAGCGAAEGKPEGSPESGASSGPASAGESKQQQSIEMRRREESMIADCMKKSGFTYIPYVPPDVLNPPAPKPTDHASLKAFRSKYGFGDVFAEYVYPGDPNVTQPEDNDPNNAIIDRLDPAQYMAYREALDGNWNDKSGDLELIGGCVAEAVKIVDPQRWARVKFSHDLLRGIVPDENSAEFKEMCDASPACKNSDADDARLKPLEDAYRACLESKGYNTVDTNVDEVARDTVSARLETVDTDPDLFTTKIDPLVARTELKNEIKVALEDLECGKDYLVTKAEIDARNRELSPPSGGLP